MTASFKSASNEFPSMSEHSALKLSRYEQVASWLIAFLVICGSVTGAMLLVWWCKSNRYQPPNYAVIVEEEGYGRGDRPAGFGRDEKAPGDPDIPQLDEPAGSELFEQMEPISALAFVEDAAAASIAEIGDIAATSVAPPRTPGFGGKGGGQGGMGDNRPPGPLGDGVFTIPRWERWEIRYTSSSVNAYAQQLDSFKVELGALGGKPEIDYAYNLAKPKPDRRSGPSKTEKRLYLTWKKGTLQQYDRTILARAGIETAGRLVVQFYPADVENMLATVEQQNAGNRSKSEYLKTIFGLRARGTNFEFYVLEQTFRSMPKR
jgi:hypothetical protein